MNFDIVVTQLKQMGNRVFALGMTEKCMHSYSASVPSHTRSDIQRTATLDNTDPDHHANLFSNKAGFSYRPDETGQTLEEKGNVKHGELLPIILVYSVYVCNEYIIRVLGFVLTDKHTHTKTADRVRKAVTLSPSFPTSPVIPVSPYSKAAN